ncbi:MAG: signal peptidase II [Actinomycetota bacterium]|nr:signal peptidase II [Actinomycetota bacterium]
MKHFQPAPRVPTGRALMLGRLAMTGTVLAVVVIDEATKAVALGRGVVHVNQGVSFGLLAERPAVAALLSTVVLMVVATVAWKWARTAPQFLAFGLILGGAVGNGLNRLGLGRSAGVVDWITMPGYPAAFNVADIAIRLGVVMIVGQLAWSLLHAQASKSRGDLQDPNGNARGSMTG